MGVLWFSMPKEGTTKPQQDQDHVNRVYWLQRSITSTPLQAKQLIRSTTSMFFVGWEMEYNKNGQRLWEVHIPALKHCLMPPSHRQETAAYPLGVELEWCLCAFKAHSTPTYHPIENNLLSLAWDPSIPLDERAGPEQLVVEGKQAPASPRMGPVGAAQTLPSIRQC